MTIVVNLSTTSARRDYAWLQAAVANWLHRTDLSAQIPDFVMLAEQRINDDLAARMQDESTTLDADPGQRELGLPDDLLAVKSLQLPGQRGIGYLSPSAFATAYASETQGIPRHYTLHGRTIRLGPTPDIAYALALTYRAGVPALADSGGSNWLIERHADVYLAATLVEAMLYTRDDTAGQHWNARYATALAGLNNTDWSAADSLAVRTDSATP